MGGKHYAQGVVKMCTGGCLAPNSYKRSCMVIRVIEVEVGQDKDFGLVGRDDVGKM